MLAILKTILLCAKNDPCLIQKLLPKNSSFINHIDLIYMYKQNLQLNNSQGLICSKTQQTNQPTISIF